jgi:hypothetical protein
LFYRQCITNFKNNTLCPLLTFHRFNSYFCYSLISHPFTSTDLLNNPFGNDLSHSLSFGHQNTHPIIDPNIAKFQKRTTSWTHNLRKFLTPFIQYPAVNMNVFSPWRELVAFQRDGDDAWVSLGYSPLSFNLLCVSNYELSK